jgi:hypothetical protein
MATCRECKHFVLENGKRGSCLKKPFRKGKSGRVILREGKPFKFITFCGTPACKSFFEPKEGE